MTVLGAVLYGGFFGLAALWLFLTSERVGPETPESAGQTHVADSSNSDSAAAASEVSSPCCVSQSSS